LTEKILGCNNKCNCKKKRLLHMFKAKFTIDVCRKTINYMQLSNNC
jgi:hypothetical protein